MIDKNNPQEKILNLKEAVKFLGVKQKLIRSAIYFKEIKHTTDKKIKYFSEGELIRWVVSLKNPETLERRKTICKQDRDQRQKDQLSQRSPTKI